MLAMQYTIDLPHDYTAEQLRSRVEDRSKLFKGLPGLMHKAYLFSQEDHLYAPFYIWSDVVEARKFLFDDLFRGVTQAFRRPRVRSWMVLSTVAKNSVNYMPTAAFREIDVIPPDTDLESFFRHEMEQQQELSSHQSLYFHAVALDADRWEILRYGLWQHAESAVKTGADCVQQYEVLHFQK